MTNLCIHKIIIIWEKTPSNSFPKQDFMKHLKNYTDVEITDLGHTRKEILEGGG